MNLRDKIMKMAPEAESLDGMLCSARSGTQKSDSRTFILQTYQIEDFSRSSINKMVRSIVYRFRKAIWL